MTIRRSVHRLALGAAALCALFVPAVSHADGEIAVKIVSVDDSRFPATTLVFTADQAGRPLPELSADSITVTESGQPARVTSLQKASDSTIPLGVVVTLDVSGSMAGANLAQSQAAATALFRNLDSGDAGALITFADAVTVAVPTTSNVEQLTQAVGATRANGNTALYDAVGESARVASTSGFQRRAVILFSDGEDFGGRSKLNRQQAIDAAVTGQALFYVIGLGSQIDRPFLEEVAARSGGQFFVANNPTEVLAIYANIEEILSSQYVLTFDSQADAALQERTVAVTVRQGALSGTQQVPYRSVRPAVTPTAVATAEPTASASPVAEEPERGESDSSSALPLLLGLLVVAGALGVGFILYRRRKVPSAEPPVVMTTGEAPPPSPVVFERERPEGNLEAFRGDELLQRVALNGAPVTVGSAPACDLRLDIPGAKPSAWMRVWWRDGSPMAHALAEADPPPVLNGARFTWATLKHGDELTVGPYSLRYVVPAQEAAGATAISAASE